MKFLIVDDEPDILELMEEEFKFLGYDIMTASSGEEAIELLKQFQFDIVISDYRMPKGNGLFVLNYVNSIKPKPLFLFVSGQADLSLDECIKAGAKMFFSKPFDLDTLTKEIKNLVNNLSK
jgi:DNA-binding NtrC family response regulator